MNIDSLNNVQNFSALKNLQENNTITSPNFKVQETVERPQKQIVDAQTALANYTMPQFNMSFSGHIDNQQNEFELYSKEQELKEINKQIEETKSKFMEEHKNNLPSAEERYKEGIVRGSVRGRFGTIIGWAKALSMFDNMYLEHMWNHSPEAQELYLKKHLISMTPSELELYNESLKNAINILDENNVLYNKNSLSMLTPEELSYIANGTCANSEGEILCHGDAHLVNTRLRMGLEVDDPIRVILDEGFRTVKPLEHPETVYRGVVGNSEDNSIEFIRKLVTAKKGDIVSDKGYAYSSYVKNCAYPCHGTQDPGTPIFNLIINVPKGARVSNGKSWEQCEMLFPRNAEFKVIKEAKITSPGIPYECNGQIKKPSDTMEIVLEYIIPKT